MGAGLDPRSLPVVRLGGATAVAVALLAAVRPALLRLPRAAWWPTAWLGLDMLLLQLCYYRAISATNVGTAVFLEFLAPTLVVAVAWRTGRLAFESRSIGAVGMSVAGGLLLVAGQGGLLLSPPALAWGLGAAGLLAGQNLLVERALQSADKVSVFVHSTAVAALLSLVVGAPGAALSAPWNGSLAASAAYLIVLATIVPTLLLMYAIGRIGAARAGMVGTLEPVTASVAAMFTLAESLAPAQWGGGLLIVLGVVLIRLAPARATQLPHANSTG